MNSTGRQVPNMPWKIGGERTPERMKVEVKLKLIKENETMWSFLYTQSLGSKFQILGRNSHKYSQVSFVALAILPS